MGGTVTAGNLFAGLPAQPVAEEEFTALLARPGLTIQRIVSTGQASPAGFWYDQADGEWVLLLQGAARLRFADEATDRILGPGDWLDIAPRRQHRVAWTAPDRVTVWLAVHYAGPTSPQDPTSGTG